MNKEDYVWVGIRLFGVYLLVLVVINLPGLISSGYSAYSAITLSRMSRSMGDKTQASKTDAPEVFERLERNAVVAQTSDCLMHVCRIILFTLAGLYMTCRGQMVFNLVSAPLKKTEAT